MLLDSIASPADLKGLSEEALKTLAGEIRQTLIQSLSETGGHVSSNLGIVELTLAIYKVFDAPKDKIIWDVGHQTYVQKLLTGRRTRFNTLRTQGGISGFTRAYESEYDLFNSGHASNSISLAYGMAKARDLQKQSGEVIAVIGDGALSGGMAFEALNNAGKGESKVIIILNDNEMAIGQNVGHMASNLSHMRTRRTYLRTKLDVKKVLLHMPVGGRWLFNRMRRLKKRIKYFLLDGVFFEEMGFTYLGPVDGHDLPALIKVLEESRNLDESVIIHVRTRKGKGYKPAERDPAGFHGIGPFDIKTGEPRSAGCKSWSACFGDALLALAKEDPKITAITAAMEDGTGLGAFAHRYPERFFDVGIAESHAVTFAAGLAKAGMRPVVAVYSTFLQRAYDSVLHDVCLNDLPVVFAVDRAGIVGEDGESHQGIYDLAYLLHIPGLTVMAPAGPKELRAMLQWALRQPHPVVIRYPRGEAKPDPVPAPIHKGQSVVTRKGSSGIAVLALGCCVPIAEKAAGLLAAQGLDITVVNARFAAPLDTQMLQKITAENHLLVTVEDHVDDSGFGEHVLAALPADHPIKTVRIAIPDQFVRQGSREALLTGFGISPEGIAKTILEAEGKGQSHG